MVGQPAPKPVYVFRPTHQDLLKPNNLDNKKDIPTRSINHLEFINLEATDKASHHLSLLTVDNHGWASIWNLDSRRIQCLWQPHPLTESIGGCLWASPLYYNLSGRVDKSHSSDSHDLDQSSLLILSQGRDHKLKLHQIDHFIEICTISTIARANLKPTAISPSPNVRTVAEASINSINFCKASLLKFPQKSLLSQKFDLNIHSIVAAPSSITEELVDIFGISIDQPPQIIKIYQGIPSHNNQSEKRPTGSVVAVQLFSPPGATEDEGLIILTIGYESGEVQILKNERLEFINSNWEMVARFKCHSEPILSLAISIDPVETLTGIAWSVGADRNIAKYHFSCLRIDPASSNSSSLKQSTSKFKHEIKTKAMVFETNQVGRFDIKIRSDGKVLGIYNWGGKVWLFDAKGTSPEERIKQIQAPQEDEYDNHEYFKLKPIGLLNLPTDPSNRSGVIAFSPFPPPPALRNSVNTCSSYPRHLDSLVGLALLVASGLGGQVTAWEVFPPPLPPTDLTKSKPP